MFFAFFGLYTCASQNLNAGDGKLNLPLFDYTTLLPPSASDSSSVYLIIHNPMNFEVEGDKHPAAVYKNIQNLQVKPISRVVITLYYTVFVINNNQCQYVDVVANNNAAVSYGNGKLQLKAGESSCLLVSSFVKRQYDIEVSQIASNDDFTYTLAGSNENIKISSTTKISATSFMAKLSIKNDGSSTAVSISNFKPEEQILDKVKYSSGFYHVESDKALIPESMLAISKQILDDDEYEEDDQEDHHHPTDEVSDHEVDEEIWRASNCSVGSIDVTTLQITQRPICYKFKRNTMILLHPKHGETQHINGLSDMAGEVRHSLLGVSHRFAINYVTDGYLKLKSKNITQINVTAFDFSQFSERCNDTVYYQSGPGTFKLSSVNSTSTNLTSHPKTKACVFFAVGEGNYAVTTTIKKDGDVRYLIYNKKGESIEPEKVSGQNPFVIAYETGETNNDNLTVKVSIPADAQYPYFASSSKYYDIADGHRITPPSPQRQKWIKVLIILGCVIGGLIIVIVITAAILFKLKKKVKGAGTDSYFNIENGQETSSQIGTKV